MTDCFIHCYTDIKIFWYTYCDVAIYKPLHTVYSQDYELRLNTAMWNYYQPVNIYDLQIKLNLSAYFTFINYACQEKQIFQTFNTEEDVQNNVKTTQVYLQNFIWTGDLGLEVSNW